jgi:hypothetical protein
MSALVPLKRSNRQPILPPLAEHNRELRPLLNTGGMHA